MKKDLAYYMKLNYRIEIVEDCQEGGYVLSYPELNGCLTCADDVETGLRLLKDAQREWITACLEDGLAIPEPCNTKV